MKRPSEGSLQPKWINIEDFEFICFNVARKFLEFNEPIPDYSTRENSLLESSLAAPRQAFEYTKAPLERQASILFYSLIKNHPFKNGNKRIAVVTLLVFLSLNNKWLEINPSFFYEIAVLVAKSDPKERDYILEKNTKLLNKFIVGLKV
jgi:death-on-curing family protein